MSRKKKLTLDTWQEAAGLSDRQAVVALGVGSRNTYAKWKQGEAPVPLYIRLAVAALAAGLEPAGE